VFEVEPKNVRVNRAERKEKVLLMKAKKILETKAKATREKRIVVNQNGLTLKCT
jgi:hypothetical protein